MKKLTKEQKEQALGVIRHILTFGSGLIVANGVLDDATAQTIIGSVMALIGAIWSISAKQG